MDAQLSESLPPTAAAPRLGPARRLLRLAPGETLWHQHDLADEMAEVLEGRFTVLVSHHPVAHVGKGELLGEASLFLPQATRTATVRAESDALVSLLDRRDLARLRRDEPDAYAALLDRSMRTLAERMAASGERLARLAEGDTERPEAAAAPAPEPAATAEDAVIRAQAARLALRNLPSLADISEAELDALAGAFRSRVLQPGEQLFAEGDTCRSVYVLARGRLELVRNIGTNSAFSVTTLEDGAEVGLLGLLLGTPRNATAIARQVCWLLEMRIEDHSALEGTLRLTWNEAVLAALREHIVDASAHVAVKEARRAALLGRGTDAPRSGAAARAAWPARDPAARERIRQQAIRILQALAPHRRLYPDAGACVTEPCALCFGLHLPKVERAVAAGAPIEMILPAYPAKSPNRETKVLGTLPDMAEEQSLRYLQRVCDDIRKVYEPGARVTICSDGRVFSDLVLVEDELITAYGEQIDRMLEDIGLSDIRTFAIEQLFERSTFDDMRDHLAVHYGEPVEQLQARAADHAETRAMHNGIHRFLIEDTKAVRTDLSRSQIKKECKGRAYHVIQRSNAFSRLIAECFPDAVRLSIHPQAPHAAKVGILLGTASDAWITPWHGVAVLQGDDFHLMKRAEAEAMGATLVHRNGRPSHFEVSA